MERLWKAQLQGIVLKVISYTKKNISTVYLIQMLKILSNIFTLIDLDSQTNGSNVAMQKLINLKI